MGMLLLDDDDHDDYDEHQGNHVGLGCSLPPPPLCNKSLYKNQLQPTTATFHCK